MAHTEMTPNGLATYHAPDFRTYAPEGTMRGGERIIYQLCESFEGGKWEGFVSIKMPKALRKAMGQ
jgi:hypothetical protein